jgi:hypothetical protein
MNERTADRPRGRLPHHVDWLMLIASVGMIGWVLIPR